MGDSGGLRLKSGPQGPRGWLAALEHGGAIGLAFLPESDPHHRGQSFGRGGGTGRREGLKNPRQGSSTAPSPSTNLPPFLGFPLAGPSSNAARISLRIPLYPL